MALNTQPPPPYHRVTGSDIQILNESAMKAFQILEPWMDARVGSQSSGLEEFDRLVAGIRAQGKAFVFAIDFSVKTSQYGVELARRLAALQSSLSNSNFASQDQTLQYIQDLKNSVVEARKKAEETLARFQAVRRGVLELTHLIPLIVDLVMARILKVHRSQNFHQSAAKFATSASALFANASKMSLAMIPIPVLAIICPILFPVLDWSAGKIADIEAWKAKVRHREKLTLEALITRIENVDNDLSALLKQFRPFASWWSGVETELDSVARKIRDPSSSPQQIVLITQEQLTSICTLYGDYAFEIGRLMDLHLCPMLQNAGDILGDDDTMIISLCPSTAVSLLSNRVIEWQTAFESLRRVTTSTKEKYQMELVTLLDDIWFAMANEFKAHISLLRKISIQARNSARIQSTLDEKAVMEVSDAARSSLKRHLGTAQFIAESMEQLRTLFIDKAPKNGTIRSRLYQKATPVLESHHTHRFISSRDEAFADNSVILERFVVSSNNVGVTCSHLALLDLTGSKIDHIRVEAALTAISHLNSSAVTF